MQILQLAVIALLGALQVLAAGAMDRTFQVHYADELSPLNIRPVYEHGFLAVYGRQVKVYAQDGSVLFAYQPARGSVNNIGIDGDATVAFSIEGWNDPNGGAVAVVDHKGTQIQLIQTPEYTPSGVCFAPDHSLWVIGGQPESDGDQVTEYELLRHYSLDGRELGRYLPRSSFPAGGNPAHVFVGGLILRASNERIGAFLDFGNHRKALWIETTFAGKEVGRWSADTGGHPQAFTPSGAVYAQGAGDITILDHASGEWGTANVSSYGALIGADADALVFAVRGQSVMKTPPGH